MARIVSTSDAAIDQQTSTLIVTALQDAILARGHARFAIAGGSATAPLASIREALGPEWQKVRLTWVDERCVDREDSDSNRGGVYREGGLSPDDPPGLELPLWLDGETVEKAMARVEESLERDFSGALDVTLLGMGPDGHIASLFPGHQALRAPSDGSIAYVSDSPKPPPRRMTLTLPFLEKTSQSILLAKGEAKREPLQRIVDGDLALPASSLPNLTIITNIQLSAHEAT